MGMTGIRGSWFGRNLLFSSNKSRKGFIYTLESIIASLLILGVSLTILPGFQDVDQTNANIEPQIFSGLKTLDRTGNLAEKSAPEVNLALGPYVPEGYSYSVEFTEVERVEENISAPYDVYISENGDSSDLQLWISSANDLDVTFAGQSIIEGYSGSGYKQSPLSHTEGWLNFTGSADVKYSFDTYQSTGNNVDAGTVSITNYVILEDDLKEIRVKTWR